MQRIIRRGREALGEGDGPYQWGQDGTGADGVDSDPLFLDDLIAQSSGETYYSTFCGCIVDQLGVSDERVDTGVVDDGGSPGHAWQERFGEVEDGVDVGLEDVFPLLVFEVDKGFNLVLGTGVVEQDVDFAVEYLLGFLGERVAFGLVAQVGDGGFKLCRGAFFLDVGC